MTELYVRFHKEAENDPTLEDEGRAWFKKIEDNDPEAMEIFRWFKEVTLKDAARVYDILGVSFDSYAGESFYNDKMEPVVQELRDKGLLVESQGAQVVDLGGTMTDYHITGQDIITLVGDNYIWSDSGDVTITE
jgi:arginyl-tRNA synthetase